LEKDATCHANKAQASSYNESPEINKGKTKDKETPRSHPTGTIDCSLATVECCGVKRRGGSKQIT